MEARRSGRARKEVNYCEETVRVRSEKVPVDHTERIKVSCDAFSWKYVEPNTHLSSCCRACLWMQRPLRGCVWRWKQSVAVGRQASREDQLTVEKEYASR